MFGGLHLRFMAIRNYVFSAAALVSVAVAVMVAVNGLNLGIDFTGGSLLQIQARQGTADAEAIAGVLDEANLGDVSVRTGRDPATATVRIPAQGGGVSAGCHKAGRAEHDRKFDGRIPRQGSSAGTAQFSMLSVTGVTGA